MFMQKITIIIPEQIIELVFSEKNGDFIRYSTKELDGKLILYRTFDIHNSMNNDFELELTHEDFNWDVFDIYVNLPEKYVSEIQYEIKWSSHYFYIE